MADAPDILTETQDYHRRQREVITQQRDVLLAQRDEIQSKLDTLNDLLVRFDRFDAPTTPALSGPPAARRRGNTAAIRSTTTASAPPRGGKQIEVLRIIEAGNGLTRGQILERMGVKGDKSAEMSVSNALTTMFKANKISRIDGKYVAAPSGQTPSAAAAA